jgi:hypothetical protein
MSEFDPTRPSMVHDWLNERMLDWDPVWAASYRECASNHAPGVIKWAGRLFDGWSMADVIDLSGRQRRQTKSRLHS